MTASSNDVAVILPAAGSGQRFGAGENKLFASLSGMPIWLHSARAMRAHARVRRVLMPVSKSDRPRFEAQFATELRNLRIELLDGGAARTDSVWSGVRQVEDDSSIELVAIHDAARPLVKADDLDAVFRKASATGAAILATPVSATVKQTFDAGVSCRTIDRSTLWLAQTPQVFRRCILKTAYQKHRGRPATDDAELVSRIGIDVALVRGSEDNIKITHPHDLLVAEAILSSRTKLKHG